MTKRDKREAMMAEMEQKLKEGIELLGAQRERRHQIREQWKSEFGDLTNAHLFATSATAILVNRHSGKPATSSKSIDGRLSLTASFVQGIDVCEVCISEGLYFQASALLKQEVETVAAIQEHISGRRTDGRTPNVGRLPMGLAALYGSLNDFAHVGVQDILRNVISLELNETVRGASVMPIYNKDLALKFYAVHVTLILLNAIEIDRLLGEMYGQQAEGMELVMIRQGFEILKASGFLGESNKKTPM